MVMGGPGSGGHNRKSVETHLTRGTFRADRHAKVVNLPTSAPPPAPPGLSAAAQARWTQLVSEFAGWTEHEYVLLEMALIAGDRAVACRERIAREGLTIAASPKGKGGSDDSTRCCGCSATPSARCWTASAS